MADPLTIGFELRITRFWSRRKGGRVFLVHGHNHEVMQIVARFLEHIGLKPIILHEQPSAGTSVLEKLERYSTVEFAVVLLTADDIGYSVDESQRVEKRARQNVIFELGFFIGRIGRGRVCALHDSAVSLPSDYSDIVYVEMGSNEAWKLYLAREIREAGLPIDSSGIIPGSR